MSIDDEELKKELVENSKTVQQVAEEYGYQNRSSISRRAKRLGLENKSKLAMLNRGGCNAYINADTVKKALQYNGFSRDTDEIFFTSKAREDGSIVLELTNKKWEQKQEEKK